MNRLPHGWAVANLEARISAHVHAWDKAKNGNEPLVPELLPFITISREYGCEGLALSLHLQEILNHRCKPFFPWVAYDNELLSKVARELNLARNVVEAVDGKRRSEMSEFFDALLNRHIDDTLVVRKLAEVIRSLAIHGHAIILGRGSYHITQDLKNGLHIRLVAPQAWRVAKISADRNLSQHDAEKIAIEGECGRTRYLETFFNHDVAHPFHHDLIIDNSRFNLAQITEIVFTALSARFGATLVGS